MTKRLLILLFIFNATPAKTGFLPPLGYLYIGGSLAASGMALGAYRYYRHLANLQGRFNSLEERLNKISQEQLPGLENLINTRSNYLEELVKKENQGLRIILTSLDTRINGLDSNMQEGFAAIETNAQQRHLEGIQFMKGLFQSTQTMHPSGHIFHRTDSQKK